MVCLEIVSRVREIDDTGEASHIYYLVIWHSHLLIYTH